MTIDERGLELLLGLADREVDFLVVGGTAAVLQGAPVVTQDLDIVHQRTPDNAKKLYDFLLSVDAHHRDLTSRRLPPRHELLLAVGEGYEQLVDDADDMQVSGRSVKVLGLRRLIAVKAATGRSKDKLMLPTLIATLDEREKASS